MVAEAHVIPSLADWHGASQLHHYFVCDVFTAQPLTGNQLAVFVDGRPFGDGQMQRLALEMNFSETVFLLPPGRGGDVRMRIFTPRAELPFAGHPVLGTAFVAALALDRDAVALETAAGNVVVRLERSGDRVEFGWMEQPLPSWRPVDNAGEIAAALGIDGSTLPVERYDLGPGHIYFMLDSPDAVAALAPDAAALARATRECANCFARDGAHWKTRMFAPGSGVVEDAATGSAAGPLAVHLARHGEIAFGDQIEIHQGVEIGRPSVLYARASGDGDRIDAVEVGGAAVIVGEGRFRIAQG